MEIAMFSRGTDDEIRGCILTDEEEKTRAFIANRMGGGFYRRHDTAFFEAYDVQPGLRELFGDPEEKPATLERDSYRADCIKQLVAEHRAACHDDCTISCLEMGRLYQELKRRPLVREEWGAFR